LNHLSPPPATPYFFNGIDQCRFFGDLVADRAALAPTALWQLHFFLLMARFVPRFPQ
jgi:hypothetical protein